MRKNNRNRKNKNKQKQPSSNVAPTGAVPKEVYTNVQMFKDMFNDFAAWFKRVSLEAIKDYSKAAIVILFNVLFVFLLASVTSNQVVIYIAVSIFGFASLFVVSVPNWREALANLKLKLNNNAEAVS